MDGSLAGVTLFWLSPEVNSPTGIPSDKRENGNDSEYRELS